MQKKSLLNFPFFKDREYYRLLLNFSVPIAIQSFITSALNMTAVVLIGQLGEISVAAVSLANQILFLLNLIVFGLVSGAAIFIAQLWGKRDVENIQRVLGLTIKIGLLLAFLFWIVAFIFPTTALKVYSEDLNVIRLGSRYLRILGWSFGFFTITTILSISLRCVGNVRLPMLVGSATLGFNVLLSYPLIFGIEQIHLPALGTDGAALAGLIARVAECSVMVFLVYRDKSNPIRPTIKHILDFDLKFMRSVMRPILPVIANEALWSLGITAYNAIYGHIGTNAIAAVNIVQTIEQIAFVPFLGVGTATAIMVGNLIGQGDKEKAFVYAGRSLLLQGSGALLMGMIVYLCAGVVFPVYKVSPEVISIARSIIIVIALGLWVRATNHVLIIGVLRSGGDTRFSLFLDGMIIWIIGVPLSAAGAFLFDWPIYLVYALALSEEVTKFCLGLWRYFSHKWINELTHSV